MGMEALPFGVLCQSQPIWMLPQKYFWNSYGGGNVCPCRRQGLKCVSDCGIYRGETFRNPKPMEPNLDDGEETQVEAKPG